MKILFSPIGMSDPITALGDGPMLHTVRHYQPDEVVLLLSPRVQEFQATDQRYTRALERLAEHTGTTAPKVSIEKSKLDEPHRYDIYIEEFRRCIQRIEQRHPGAQILLNASSGTPGMKMALIVLDAFGIHENTQVIQVASPRKSESKTGDREDPKSFDLELYWEHNPDNHGETVNRCTVVQSINFRDLIVKRDILTLLDRYEYRASRELVDSLSSPDPRAVELLDGCVARLEMDFQKAASLFNDTDFPLVSGRKLQEYVQVLQVKLEKGQWVDFLRALTPALTQALYDLLEPKLPRNKFCDMKGNLRWDLIDRDGRLKRVLRDGKKYRPFFAGNDDLLDLLVEFGGETQLIKDLRSVRELEKQARNRAAHEITTGTLEQIEKSSEISLNKALQILMSAAQISRPQRNLYSRINAQLRVYFE